MRTEKSIKIEDTYSSRWTILSVTTLSAFMVAVDSTIVVIAIPVIGRELSSGVSELSWLISAYILTAAALLLQFGKLGDRRGRRKVYLIGFAIFGVASALCGVSSNIYELIGFRLVQGMGAAMLSATSYPLIFASFSPGNRGTAIGINSIAWSVGAVAGPVAGGLLVSVDWRLIFFINVPIAAAAVVIGSKRIPKSLDQRSLDVKGINPISSVLLAFTVAMVLIWLTFFDIIFAIIGAFGLVALIFSESKSANALLNKELRANKGFIYSIIALAVTNLGVLGIPFALTFFYQIVVGVPPILTGIFIVPLAVAEVIANPLSGRLFDRMKKPASLSLIGTTLNAIATILLGLAIVSEANSWYIETLIAILGVGGGLVWTPLISSALKFAKPELRGVANGTAFTLVNLGFAASVAILIAVSATILPQAVVSQIYIGKIGGLASGTISLFNHGLSQSIFVLGIIDLIAILPLVFVILEQRKSP